MVKYVLQLQALGQCSETKALPCSWQGPKDKTFCSWAGKMPILNLRGRTARSDCRLLSLHRVKEWHACRASERKQQHGQRTDPTNAMWKPLIRLDVQVAKVHTHSGFSPRKGTRQLLLRIPSLAAIKSKNLGLMSLPRIVHKHPSGSIDKQFCATSLKWHGQTSSHLR